MCYFTYRPTVSLLYCKCYLFSDYTWDFLFNWMDVRIYRTVLCFVRSLWGHFHRVGKILRHPETLARYLVYFNTTYTRGVARDKSMYRQHYSRYPGACLYRRSCILEYFKAYFGGFLKIFCSVCQDNRKPSVLYSGYIYFIVVSTVCMMCTLSSYGGPGDILPWIYKNK